MKKKEYIKQMNKMDLEKIKVHLKANNIPFESIDLNTLREFVLELRAEEKGMHVLDGLFDITSPKFTELQYRYKVK